MFSYVLSLFRIFFTYEYDMSVYYLANYIHNKLVIQSLNFKNKLTIAYYTMWSLVLVLCKIFSLTIEDKSEPFWDIIWRFSTQESNFCVIFYESYYIYLPN